MKRILRPILAALAFTLAFAFVPMPQVDASTDTAVSVERPADNETNLSFFSCAATRPNPPGSTTGGQLTVNHSHRIAADSSPGHWDAFDCEGYLNPGINGCVWRTYYIYDGDPDIGIFGPANVTCFGDWPA